MKAIALLEVQAMVAAITGLDAMVKAADVKLIHVEKRLGGRLVTVVVEGEVSAVSAALEAGAAAAAERQEVDIRLYRVIYQAIEEIEAAMKGMLDPKYKESVIGHAEVRQTFKVSGVGTIAGGYVTDGKIARNAQVRVVRDGIVFHEGVLNSLKRFKDDAKEVMSGYECGIGIEKFNDIKDGDVIECFIMEEIKQ